MGQSINLSFREHTPHLNFLQFSSEIELQVIQNIGVWHSDSNVTKYLGEIGKDGDAIYSKTDPKKWFDDCIFHPGKSYFLITYDKKPIGYVGIHVPWPWSKAFETNLVIGEELYRGKGIGMAVSEYIIRDRYDRGFEKVRVTVHPENVLSNSLAIKALDPIPLYRNLFSRANKYEGKLENIIGMLDSISTQP